MELRVDGTTFCCESVGAGRPCVWVHGGPAPTRPGSRARWRRCARGWSGGACERAGCGERCIRGTRAGTA